MWMLDKLLVELVSTWIPELPFRLLIISREDIRIETLRYNVCVCILWINFDLCKQAGKEFVGLVVFALLFISIFVTASGNKSNYLRYQISFVVCWLKKKYEFNYLLTTSSHIIQRLMLSFLLVHPDQEEWAQGDQKNRHSQSYIQRKISLCVRNVRCNNKKETQN